MMIVMMFCFIKHTLKIVLYFSLRLLVIITILLLVVPLFLLIVIVWVTTFFPIIATLTLEIAQHEVLTAGCFKQRFAANHLANRAVGCPGVFSYFG